MKTVAVLPIKRFDQAKQRLDGVVGRPALATAMASDALRALTEARRLFRVLVVSNDPEALALADDMGAEVVHEPRTAGHNPAARRGIARAAAIGADRVLLAAGDCPLLAADDVDALLERHRGPGVVVVPDRHGTGTNALLLTPPGAIGPAFGEGSRERHEQMARAAGLAVVVDEVPAFANDVDTADDLAVVRTAMLDGDDEASVHTRGLLGWLDSIG